MSYYFLTKQPHGSSTLHWPLTFFLNFRSHVPEPWGQLMFDPESKIIDFYPEDFKIDLNGKKYAWQGVALLPFVDEIRLKAACNPLREKLTAAEIARNVRGDDRMYVREGHKGNKKNYLVTQCL